MNKQIFRNRKSLGYLFFLLVHVCSFISANAQATFTAKLDTNVLLIGDQVKLTLQSQHAEGVRVAFPVLPDTLNKLEILSRSKIDTIRDPQQKGITEKQTFILTGFDSGYFAIPPIPFLASNQQGTVDTVTTEPMLITVRTLAVDTALASVRDIKSPLEVPFTWKDALPYLLGGLALALVVFLLYYFLRKKKKPEVEVKRRVPTRPAHEIAFEELDKLHDEKLWQQGKVKLYHSRLTDIIRQYIEHRFGIYAMEKTTDEIMESFKEDGLDLELRKKLKSMLELADFVKFAKVQPLPDENQRGLDDAYAFVKETMSKKNESVTSNGSVNE